MRNLYEILNVLPDATKEQIRAAYLLKVKEAHDLVPQASVGVPTLPDGDVLRRQSHHE